jgi:hypothetical protein
MTRAQRSQPVPAPASVRGALALASADALGSVSGWVRPSDGSGRVSAAAPDRLSLQISFEGLVGRPGTRPPTTFATTAPFFFNNKMYEDRVAKLRPLITITGAHVATRVACRQWGMMPEIHRPFRGGARCCHQFAFKGGAEFQAPTAYIKIRIFVCCCCAPFASFGFLPVSLENARTFHGNPYPSADVVLARVAQRRARLSVPLCDLDFLRLT